MYKYQQLWEDICQQITGQAVPAELNIYDSAQIDEVMERKYSASLPNGIIGLYDPICTPNKTMSSRITVRH